MVWEYAVKRNFETVFDQIIESYNIPEKELGDLIEAYHSGTPEITLYPEAETVLSTLPSSCQRAVVTGGKYGRKKLQLLGIFDAFDEVYVTPENNTTKRDAAPFESVLDALKVDPKQAVFVGDNPELDFYWPNRLGMVTVWVRRPHTLFGVPVADEIQPNYVLPDLSLIPHILKNEG
jgi:putative hydrolase of the HAD superfamily